jgi:hypothetical protein
LPDRLGRRTTRRAIPWAAAAVLALAPAAPPALAGGAGDREQRPRIERLERRGVRSYFAFVNFRAAVHSRPRRSARTRTRLGLRTEDGTDELVLVLARTTDATGRAWLRVRLPTRPNQSTGWVVEDALGPLHLVRTWLVVDTRRRRATLVKRGRVVFRARVGVGEPRWPTPRGEFYIRHKLRGYGSAGSFYGPVAFGTNARSTRLTDWPGGAIVGIHGTSAPALIPGRISHGCVRLRNPDILRLERLMPVGTPLTIR